MSKIKLSRKVKNMLRSRVSKKEKVLLYKGQTAWRYGFPLLLMLVLFMVAVIGYMVSGGNVLSNSKGQIGLVIVIFLSLLLITWSIFAKMRSRHFVLLATNMKLLVNDNINATIELDYTKLEDVAVKQDILGKIMGYGSLTIVNKMSNSGMMIDLGAIYNNRSVEYIADPYGTAKKIKKIIKDKQLEDLQE